MIDLKRSFSSLEIVAGNLASLLRQTTVICKNIGKKFRSPKRRRIEGQVLQYDSELFGGGAKKLGGEKRIV